MKARSIFVSTVGLLTWVTVAAAAAEGGNPASGGHAGGASQAQWILLGCAIFNFSLFVYLMRRFTGRPLSDFLLARRGRVREAIEAAAKAKQEAQQVKAEYEARAASLESTRREMIEEMRAMAEADRTKTLAAVREVAERLLRDAERTAESDLERAKRDLRAQAAALASEAARTEIGERLGGADHRRLVNDFLTGVDRQQ